MAGVIRHGPALSRCAGGGARPPTTLSSKLRSTSTIYEGRSFGGRTGQRHNTDRLQHLHAPDVPSLFRSFHPSTVMSSTPSDSLVQQLSGFSACEISDALIKLGSPNGGHIPDIHLVSPPDSKICGPAYTVQMVFSSVKNAPKLSSHFVDTAPAGTVIVINAPPSLVPPFFRMRSLN